MYPHLLFSFDKRRAFTLFAPKTKVIAGFVHCKFAFCRCAAAFLCRQKGNCFYPCDALERKPQQLTFRGDNPKKEREKQVVFQQTELLHSAKDTICRFSRESGNYST